MAVMQPFPSPAAGIFLAGLLLASPIPPLKHRPNPEYFLYVGSNANPPGHALTWYGFNPAEETVSLLGSLDEPGGVVSLVKHPGDRFLYSVSGNNALASFAVQRGTGNLRLLNRAQAKGKDACFVFADHKGWMLLVAYCGSGDVESFRVDGDGGVGESVSLQHQEGVGAHPHSITITPDNFFLFIPDLDRIFNYRFDPAKGAFWPNNPASLPLQAGSSSRALVFRSDEKFAYAIDELGSVVYAFTYNRDAGLLTFLESVPGASSRPAAIELDSAGRFLYIANRGDNSISVLAVDAKKGTLKLVQRVGAQGNAPGFLKIDPTGHLLLVADQDSNQIAEFEIDRKNGALQFSKTIDVAHPTCFQIVPMLAANAH